jgi:hypothetical protein
VDGPSHESWPLLTPAASQSQSQWARIRDAYAEGEEGVQVQAVKPQQRLAYVLRSPLPTGPRPQRDEGRNAAYSVVLVPVLGLRHVIATGQARAWQRNQTRCVLNDMPSCPFSCVLSLTAACSLASSH